jgi:hypothetical protein
VNDAVPDPRQPYTYGVIAYQADSRYGEATVDFTAPPPSNPATVNATVNGTTVSLSWPAVQHAASYTVIGPGISGTASITGTSHSVTAPPGAATYRVGSLFNPGGLQTPQSQWTAVTVHVTAPVTCACAAIGPFAAPHLRTITGGGPSGTFTHPTDGTFTVTAQSVGGSVMLDIKDQANRPVLSAGNPAAWGISPDGRWFVVVSAPQSANTGAPLSVHRVKPGPGTFPLVVSTVAFPDGWWGFSAQGAMFVVSRFQQSPNQFSLEAFNLWAATPGSAALRLNEVNVYQPSVTVSPCGDRLMYFRWTQLSPQAGEAAFYRRTGFPGSGSMVLTDWDHATSGTPAAGIAAGPGSNNFLVQLNGLKVRSTGQTTFPSLQCNP